MVMVDLASDIDPLSQDPRRAMVMTHMCTRSRSLKGHLVQKLRVETDGHTNGWMEATALPPMLMQSVNI